MNCFLHAYAVNLEQAHVDTRELIGESSDTRVRVENTAAFRVGFECCGETGQVHGAESGAGGLDGVRRATQGVGIRANVILPGLMDTPMAVDTRARKMGKSRAEVAAMRDARVPRRRKLGTAWDVANAALFLASDEANFITGVDLLVDGRGALAIGH